ncbi:MAG: orotate phosphoribosyltransferase [Treponema sp.]|jgi:orotate phosphoribosyltransferase|nr:orotate phosphoribosyltransferase [Treponema sp.]
MEKIIELLRETGAMLEGHFLLSSGRHSDKYFQCAKLLQYPDKAEAALEEVAARLKEDIMAGKLKADLVAGPAMGGIIPAWELGRQLGIPAVFTERDDFGLMVLRRGFQIQPGASVLIAEDVVTTGKSSRECAQAMEAAGAVVTGLACIVDRREKEVLPSGPQYWPLTRGHSIPMYPAAMLSARSWEAHDCELCKKGLPSVKPGSRKTP